jgi:hypothetical protein
MEAFFNTTVIVAIGEIDDKTMAAAQMAPHRSRGIFALPGCWLLIFELGK